MTGAVEIPLRIRRQAVAPRWFFPAFCPRVVRDPNGATGRTWGATRRQQVFHNGVSVRTLLPRRGRSDRKEDGNETAGLFLTETVWKDSRVKFKGTERAGHGKDSYTNPTRQGGKLGKQGGQR